MQGFWDVRFGSGMRCRASRARETGCRWTFRLFRALRSPRRARMALLAGILRVSYAEVRCLLVWVLDVSGLWEGGAGIQRSSLLNQQIRRGRLRNLLIGGRRAVAYRGCLRLRTEAAFGAGRLLQTGLLEARPRCATWLLVARSLTKAFCAEDTGTRGLDPTASQ